MNRIVPSNQPLVSWRRGAPAAATRLFRVFGQTLVALVYATAGAALSAEPIVRDPAEPRPPHPLVWDAMEKTIEAKPGEGGADFVFAVHNTADRAVEIREVRPSCGCTVAELPATPWILAPGARGSFRATVDFRGKHGRFSKGIHVISSAGTQLLGVTVNIPDTPDAGRERNRQLAATDRQAVFRGECATCHAAPAEGKTGGPLFLAACGVCHISERRASMVPDLLTAREPRDAAYWRKWIAEGKEQTLMPAFARSRGGPLDEAQIDSLVAYVLEYLPTQPPPMKR